MIRRRVPPDNGGKCLADATPGIGPDNVFCRDQGRMDPRADHSSHDPPGPLRIQPCLFVIRVSQAPDTGSMNLTSNATLLSGSNADQ